ncbi:hypothetical protein BDZ90DRAFT_106468 [Jaminaea rosea]|uniref:Uncharacterized protein n=1 Tax=Jaminaea rosea TaxID=1569628 RepID=A0A316UWL5_9BASI|nr:hypothetical protein BDZ90DRAFT_106468 [Jaminaea rosea]PWN29364.1 hypothetical protein BDZ90DRAFT_106468 [Jaminaea rosea]
MPPTCRRPLALDSSPRHRHPRNPLLSPIFILLHNTTIEWWTPGPYLAARAPQHRGFSVSRIYGSGQVHKPITGHSTLPGFLNSLHAQRGATMLSASVTRSMKMRKDEAQGLDLALASSALVPRRGRSANSGCGRLHHEGSFRATARQHHLLTRRLTSSALPVACHDCSKPNWLRHCALAGTTLVQAGEIAAHNYRSKVSVRLPTQISSPPTWQAVSGISPTSSAPARVKAGWTKAGAVAAPLEVTLRVHWPTARWQ